MLLYRGIGSVGTVIVSLVLVIPVSYTHLDVYKRQEEKRAVFEIIDNGCGIPKEKQDALFSGGFEKSAPTVDRNKNSMGIGLSVCATIIKAHGGEICAESIPGKKTKVQFSLEMEDTKHEQ